MLARHAENMFWAGRYLERAEDTARMLQATLRSSVSSGRGTASLHYRALLQTLRLDDPGPALDVGTLLNRLVSDPNAPGSIVAGIGHARENLRTLRDQIPSELWEHTNGLHLRLRRPDFARQLATEPYDTLDMVKVRCQTLAGIVATAMAREEGYRFLILGVTIERALMTCRLVNVRYPAMSSASYEETALTLRSASALEAYQRSYLSSSDPADVARFLLVNERFPRAVLACLRQAEDQLRGIGGPHTRPMRHLGRIRSSLEYADFDELIESLATHLDELEFGIRATAEEVALQYFRDGEAFDLHSQLLVPGIDA